MDEYSRRGFLGMVGAGAAVAGAVSLSRSAEARATVPESVSGPLVAYVRDARAGEVAVLVGEREVVVRDRDLAARIARAAG